MAKKGQTFYSYTEKFKLSAVKSFIWRADHKNGAVSITLMNPADSLQFFYNTCCVL